MPGRKPGVVSVKLSKEALLSLSSNPLKSVKLKPGKENTASASPNGNTGRSPNWREVGNYVDSLGGKKQVTGEGVNLTAQEISKELIYQNKNPLRTPLKYRICNHCNRPILDAVIEAHIKECVEQVKNPVSASIEAAVESKASSTPSAPTSATGSPAMGSAAPKNPRKRKLEKEKEKEEARQLRELKKQQRMEERKQKKQKKKEKEKEQREKEKESKKLQKQLEKKQKSSATTKSKKGPVDVERQCGVPLKDGGFCARSLTCKTHSMGAKRAVPGRSASYDALLAAYQRKNQVKLLASSALAQAEKDDLDHGGSQYLDSDEETVQVMEGVARSYAMPLAINTGIPVRSRNKFVRMREFYNNGFGNGKFSSHPISGRVAFFKLDNNDEFIIKPRAFNNAAQQQQQQQQQHLMQQKLLQQRMLQQKQRMIQQKQRMMQSQSQQTQQSQSK